MRRICCLTLFFQAGHGKPCGRHDCLHRRHDGHHRIAAVKRSCVVPQVTPQCKNPSSLFTGEAVRCH
uniref:Uncharacterized protein n=1 Tax=Arundo donax TaxID=35708 RepID=A0A0A9C563_ARUDO